FRRAFGARAVGASELETAHVRPEAAGDMVVLAVHVVRDGPSDRDEARAWRDRQEPARGNRDLQDLLERRAGLAPQHPARPVERDHAVETGGMEQRAAGVEAAVAVAPAAAAREERRAGGQRLVAPPRCRDSCRRLPRIAAPREERLAHATHVAARTTSTAPIAHAMLTRSRKANTSGSSVSRSR